MLLCAKLCFWNQFVPVFSAHSIRLDLGSAETDAYKCLIHLAVAYGRSTLLNKWWAQDSDPNQSVPEYLSSDPDFSPQRTLAVALAKFESSKNEEERGSFFFYINFIVSSFRM